MACLSPQVSWLIFKARATSISRSIRKERATWKSSQLAAARRVAMKMGRRPRCSSVAYGFRYAPLLAPCRRPILIATNDMLFRRQDTRLPAARRRFPGGFSLSPTPPINLHKFGNRESKFLFGFQDVLGSIQGPSLPINLPASSGPHVPGSYL